MSSACTPTCGPPGGWWRGEYLPWMSVLGGSFVIMAMSVGLFALASFIFRRRELATYSGQ